MSELGINQKNNVVCVVVALDLAMIGLEWEENHVGDPKFVLKNA